MIPREALVAAFKSVEPQCTEGHYLDRAIAIAGCYMAFQEYLPILHAYKQFLQAHHKPAGLDELIYEISYGVICVAQRSGCIDEDLRPIAWGLNWDALKDRELVHLRDERPTNVVQLKPKAAPESDPSRHPNTRAKAPKRKGSRLQPWQLNGGNK